MSEKFTRGIDEEVIKILNLTDDFQKFVLLEQQRWVELHYSRGRYFRLRIPKFGRDMDLITERSELVISTSGDEIYRLNLEQGEFLEPYRTVECWDHRDKSRVGLLDVASSISDYTNGIAAVTALKFCDPLHFGVGTSSGHVVLYDIRASKPLLVKDMQNDLPIRRIEFVRKEDDNIVLSMDNRAIKIWNERNGRPITAIEPEPSLNDFVLYPNSGMLFIAAEAPRMLQYFCPILGPAPKWCSFLEAITEELEESDKPAVYDDYKFVTEAQLDDLGLKHLIGTQLLRAYMHGFFIDIRLYNKAKLKTQPFAYENYKKRKIREAMEDEREEAAIGVKLKKESEVKVNRELAKKLELDASIANKKKKFAKEKANAAASLLQDPRFAKLFEDEEFEVDETSEIFTSLQSRLEKSQKKKKRPDEDDDDDENDGDDDRNSESDEGHPQTEFFDQLEGGRKSSK
ncbi:unnamed protein product, partial [Mesorhabditis belari]|uniref:Nucleolar protein 10 n=1 Tax=Mesorhabditis belari TaxID=2138241 RepID=A0AAF3FJT6_9BILA